MSTERKEKTDVRMLAGVGSFNIKVRDVDVDFADRGEAQHSFEGPKAFLWAARQRFLNFRGGTGIRRAALSASFESQNPRPKSQQFHFGFK